MSTESLSPQTLDALLTLQLTVAWAGEALSDPPRLGWWRTDFVDPDGGGYLFERLLGRTHKWAGLEAARRAATLTDTEKRRELKHPDAVRTLFFWGFELDELLEARLKRLKREGRTPSDTLDFPLDLFGADSFNDEAFLEVMLSRGAAPTHQVEPSGRRIKSTPPDDVVTTAWALAAALTPFSEAYPMPYFVQEA